LITACAIFCRPKFHSCHVLSFETPFASWEIGKWSR
jgi:hypothetical protein